VRLSPPHQQINTKMAVAWCKFIFWYLKNCLNNSDDKNASKTVCNNVLYKCFKNQIIIMPNTFHCMLTPKLFAATCMVLCELITLSNGRIYKIFGIYPGYTAWHITIYYMYYYLLLLIGSDSRPIITTRNDKYSHNSLTFFYTYLYV